MMVQSFRPDPSALADYCALGIFLEPDVTSGKLSHARRLGDVTLHLGWADSSLATDADVEKVVG